LKKAKLIKTYASMIVQNLLNKIDSLSSLDHNLTKGELRELFVSDVLSSFLTKQFDVGSGIIVNQKEEQSSQIDIIIYDNRIVPPFIKEQHIGVYPAESVLGVLEIKSNLTYLEIEKTENNYKHLREIIYSNEASIYSDYEFIRPLCAIIGFYDGGTKELQNSETGRKWLSKISNLRGVCLYGKYSWLKFGDEWMLSANKKNFEETKRFIAVFIDNLRTLSENRMRRLSRTENEFEHKDWLGIYIRDQGLFDD
jgi:hypothetical protein